MRLTRRDLLTSAALAALPGLGAPPRLRGKEVLPSPDFTALHDAPWRLGVRPHRRGGFRLGLDPANPGGKLVFHNYGHGGAGITLSWGCASMLCDLFLAELRARRLPVDATPVAVLGTGVIGLTVATELRRRWPTLPVHVYAKSLDVRDTTSFVAGGQFEPSGIWREYDSEALRPTLAAVLRRSRDRVVELQRSGQRTSFGVAERKNYTLDHPNRAFEQFVPPDVVPPPRRGRLPFEKLRVLGREYSTWLLNPTVLLPKLARDLREAGVRFTAQTFSSHDELAALPEPVVINCTGYGAKQLMADEQLVGQRGHLVLLKKTHEKQFYFFSGGCSNFATSYVFCRQDDIVLGGTVQSGRDSAEPVSGDEVLFERILANNRALFEGRPGACER